MGFNNFPDTSDWAKVQNVWMPASIDLDVITSQIAEHSTASKPQTEFLSAVLSEFDGSVKLANIRTAQKYYRNEPDILNSERWVLGRNQHDGGAIPIKSEVLANNQLSHNFLKKLTRQKIGYLLSKPFILSEAKKDDTEAKAFIERCQEYMGKNFFKMIKNVARDSIVSGIGWLQVYYNESGELRFRRCEPENVIPLWRDADHSILDAVIYRYIVEIYDAGEKKKQQYVDYYTDEGVYRYILDQNTGLLRRIGDPGDPPTPYLRLRFDSEVVDKFGLPGDNIPLNWDRIPFIPFKYDPDEQSLLDRIKALVDNYDKVTSQVANNIEDFPNAITVVQNYDAEDKETFVHNKNLYRTIFTTGDGDAKTLETPLNITEIGVHLERLREDIYEFGQGVNTADKDIRDTSGVALRFLYADLDMDCLDWGSEFEWSIMELFWFVQRDILLKTGEDYTKVRYGVQCRKDIIVNESEQIQNALASVGVISQRTVIENHPWTQDVEKELTDMREELEDTLDLKDEYGEEPKSPAQSQKETLGQG